MRAIHGAVEDSDADLWVAQSLGPEHREAGDIVNDEWALMADMGRSTVAALHTCEDAWPHGEAG